MQSRKRRQFSRQFKEEAVRLITEGGQSLAQVARDLDTRAKLRERAELRPSIGMHTLRHTFASLLIDQGENPKYVASQLGHASATFTLDVYGHLFDGSSAKAMDRLQETIRATERRRFKVVDGGRSS